jgi:hypothetical protein
VGVLVPMYQRCQQITRNTIVWDLLVQQSLV